MDSPFKLMTKFRSRQLHTPTRFDDLHEIIGKETEMSSALHTPVQQHQDSGYMTDKRQTTNSSASSTAPSMTSLSTGSGKENMPDGSSTGGTATAGSSHGSASTKSPVRRARKALHATWSTPGNIQVPGIGCDSISFLPETPVSE